MVISALVGMAGLLWFAARPGDRLATHGLTRDETTLTDIYTEASETFAVIDEHTASLLLHQQLRRLWGPQVHPDDARLMSMYSVSSRVNSVRWDDPLCIAPVTEAPDQLPLF